MAVKKNRNAKTWTEEESKKLETVVLESVAEGKTQKQAFAKFANLMGRTQLSVSMHWHNKLKDANKTAINKARQKAKNKSQPQKSNSKTTPEKEQQHKDITMADILAYLREANDLETKYNQLLKEYDELYQDYQELKEKFNAISQVVKDAS